MSMIVSDWDGVHSVLQYNGNSAMIDDILCQMKTAFIRVVHSRQRNVSFYNKQNWVQASLSSFRYQRTHSQFNETNSIQFQNQFAVKDF